MLPKLKVETAKTSELVPYANNAKIHSAEQIDQIAASIEQFGFSDPIGVWTRHDGHLEIVEGHGRVMAANVLGIEEVPVIKLDHLDDDARRAYVHVHNQTTLSSGFDFQILDTDLEALDFEWEDFGFEPMSFDWEGVSEITEENYDEPEKDMLVCPKCGHKDSSAHFRKAES